MESKITNVDELIYLRGIFKKDKNYLETDRIRDYLDSKLSFVFDTIDGFQEVYHMPKSVFIKKPDNMTDRKYVEVLISRRIKADRLFDAWLYTQQGKSTNLLHNSKPE